jgi:hypothetical protein
MSPPIEITLLTKAGGPLTKRISLAEDGSLKSDGSACLMGRGVARRARFADPHAFADCIGKLAQNEAITLGVLRLDLPDKVEIITKRELQKLNGAARPDLIARAGGHIVHPTGQLALALLDFDTKGMPLEVAARLKPGGYWAALVLVLQELASTARVTRRSTSSGIYRSDTGAKLPGSDGVHVFVLVKDGTDAERFLTTLHERCWLAGFGWLMIGAGGQLLERSIVDRMVGAPERLVFEGAPVLEPPLAQDQQSRRPIVTEGDVLDTVASCPPLSIVDIRNFVNCAPRKRRGSRPKWPSRERHSSPDNASASPNAPARIKTEPVVSSSVNAPASCYPISFFRLMTLSSLTAQLRTFWRIPTALKAPPSPILLKGSSTAYARRASCAGRTERHGFTVLRTDAASSSACRRNWRQSSRSRWSAPHRPSLRRCDT